MRWWWLGLRECDWPELWLEGVRCHLASEVTVGRDRLEIASGGRRPARRTADRAGSRVPDALHSTADYLLGDLELVLDVAM